MNVLVLNCGSSSLKFQLVDSVTETRLARGVVERIGGQALCTYRPYHREAGSSPSRSATTLPPSSG